MQPGQFRQNLFGGFLKTVGQQTGQTDQTFGTGRQAFVRQAYLLIPGKRSLPATATVVIGPLHANFTEHTHGAFAAVAVELRGLLAMGTDDAALVVAVFFPPNTGCRPGPQL